MNEREACGTQCCAEEAGTNKGLPFLGVKLIHAVPMTRVEWKHSQNLEATKEDCEGYRVTYPDGYQSWSPKEAFEAAYLPLQNETRITPAVIDLMVAGFTSDQIDPKTTLVKVECVTGFTQYATSACVDPNNYDANIGREIAGKKIEEGLWFALGFILQWAKNGLKHTAVEKVS